jgi:hypothetical protein
MFAFGFKVHSGTRSPSSDFFLSLLSGRGPSDPLNSRHVTGVDSDLSLCVAVRVHGMAVRQMGGNIRQSSAVYHFA